MYFIKTQSKKCWEIQLVLRTEGKFETFKGYDGINVLYIFGICKVKQKSDSGIKFSYSRIGEITKDGI